MLEGALNFFQAGVCEPDGGACELTFCLCKKGLDNWNFPILEAEIWANNDAVETKTSIFVKKK